MKKNKIKIIILIAGIAAAPGSCVKKIPEILIWFQTVRFGSFDEAIHRSALA